MPRALIPIYAIVFLDVLGLTILIPLLPALAARTHASTTLMGPAISTTALCAALSSAFWGRLSDRIGRKPVLLMSQGFSLVGYVVLAFASSLPVLFLSRAIEGFGGGNIGVAQSLIADVTAPAQRERAFAYAGAAFGIGFVVGPVLAGQLLRFGLAVPFFVAAALQATDLVLTMRYVPRISSAVQRTANDNGTLRAALKRAALRGALGRQLLYILAFTYLFTIFGLYLDRELGLPGEISSLLLGLAGAIGAAAQIVFAARLERRLGDRRLAQAAFAAAFIAYVALGFVHGSLTYFAGVLVLWAASGALLQPTLAKQIAGAAPPQARGTVLGLADALNNGAMIVSPLAAALVLEHAPWAIGIAPALCMAFAIAMGSVRSVTNGSAPSL